MTYDDTLEDIDLERARYLLSADEMMEEMLAEAATVETAAVKAETVCCGVLIDTVKAAETVDLYPVCVNNCRRFIENTATRIEITIK